jgi:hypothetical protein
MARRPLVLLLVLGLPYGHEVWQLQGADPERPYVAPPAAMAAGP